MASNCKVRGEAGLTCVHHWLIDAKNHGFCIKCGEGRQFPVILLPEDMPNSTCWAAVRSRRRKAMAGAGK